MFDLLFVVDLLGGLVSDYSCLHSVVWFVTSVVLCVV